MPSAFVIYGGFLLFGLFFLYVFLLFLEIQYGNRVASNFRLRLDEIVRVSFNRFRRLFFSMGDTVGTNTALLHDEVIRPIATPIKKHYAMYKRTENMRQFTGSNKNQVSPHLKELTKISLKEARK